MEGFFFCMLIAFVFGYIISIASDRSNFDNEKPNGETVDKS